MQEAKHGRSFQYLPAKEADVHRPNPVSCEPMYGKGHFNSNPTNDKEHFTRTVSESPEGRMDPTTVVFFTRPITDQSGVNKI
ncbi:hypothetical protein MRX96_027462 [Rhipicephalus microplus]